MSDRRQSEREQEVLALFIADPELERRVRSSPALMASELGVSSVFIEKLRSIDESRVVLLRASTIQRSKGRSSSGTKT